MRRAGSLLAVALLALAGCRGAGETTLDFEVTTEPAGRFSCRGNEPFWDLEIEGDGATYRALAEELRERRFAGSLHRVEEDVPARYEWRGAEEPGGGQLVASIVEERCLDTMSDETPPFPYAIQLELPDGEIVHGCCRGGDAAGE